MSNIKKYLITMLAVLMISASNVYAGNSDLSNQIINSNIMNDYSVTIVVNGVELQQKGFMIKGTQMAPARALLDSIGAPLNWNPKDQFISSTFNYGSIEMYIDSPFVYLNGIPMTFNVPAVMVNGITYLPVEPVIRTFMGKTEWNAGERKMYVSIEEIIYGDYINVEEEKKKSEAIEKYGEWISETKLLEMGLEQGYIDILKIFYQYKEVNGTKYYKTLDLLKGLAIEVE